MKTEIFRVVLEVPAKGASDEDVRETVLRALRDALMTDTRVVSVFRVLDKQ